MVALAGFVSVEETRVAEGGAPRAICHMLALHHRNKRLLMAMGCRAALIKKLLFR